MIKEPLQTPVPERRIRPRTFAGLLDGLTISTIIIIFVSVALLYLTNISVDLNMSWKDFGYEAVILYIFTVTINFLARSVAKRKGRETDAHKKAFYLLESLENEIIESGLRGSESDYCRAWEEEELHAVRKSVLSSANVDITAFEQTYLKYSNRELKARQKELCLTDFQLKTIKKAKRIKRLRYNERYLSASLKVGHRIAPDGEINTNKYETFRTLNYLFTALAGVCVSASIALDIIADPTFGTIVMCVIKIITILISAISGMIGGYRLTAEMETEELSRKAVEQKNFLIWCRENKVK